MKRICFRQTPIGKIGIIEENDVIVRVCFEGEDIQEDVQEYESKVLNEASKQLQEYFEGSRKKFDLPLNPEGTSFMQEVWEALLTISYGQTKSYKEIAEHIGRNKAYRAVGLANNRNPIPIFIPCHRVVGTNGKLVGYAGGLDVKTYLLELERKY